MESKESLKGNIVGILRFHITKVSSNEKEKNYIENVFQEISKSFECINTETLLNVLVKEKSSYVNYEVKLLGKTLTRKKLSKN